jgi:ubiquinone/menaquinone biosynthesis C-methylase UbiE
MFTDPIKNLKLFDLRENMLVADLGAGTGFYTIPASQIVSFGKVYAVDIERDFLRTIFDKVKELKINNIECLWGDVEKNKGTKLADDLLDAVIASNIFFQVEDKLNFIEEVRRILKKGGKVLFIDKKPDTLLTNSVSNKFFRYLDKEKVLKLFEEKGFKKLKDIDAGTFHHGMILIREN